MLLLTSEAVWTCLQETCDQDPTSSSCTRQTSLDLQNSRRRWSTEEDIFISDAVSHSPAPPPWRQLARDMYAAFGTYRTDDAIRNRWKRLSATPEDLFTKTNNNCEPRVYWSRIEDEQLIRLVSEEGLKWRRFKPFFPGRTIHSIRNRYNRLSLLKNAL